MSNRFDTFAEALAHHLAVNPNAYGLPRQTPILSIEKGSHKGDTVEIISKNYQTGSATVRSTVTGSAYDVPLSELENLPEDGAQYWFGVAPYAVPKCECGVDAVRDSGGKHSTYCPKFSREGY